MKRLAFAAPVILSILLFSTRPAATTGPESAGALQFLDDDGASLSFPLKHTDVHATISGCVARVEVTQTFQNPFDRPIEAVYVFPLPDRAAVDDLEIRIGDRRIRGVVHRREEARVIYAEARSAGYLAALLDQERPNVFTQAVANILPGKEVEVALRYLDPLPYEAGHYEMVFPMVVAPRYTPRAVSTGTKRSGEPDPPGAGEASRIEPPVLESGRRPGRDISLEVRVNAGAPLRELTSPTHAVEVTHDSPARATVRLRPDDTLPNKDFVLRYDIDGADPQISVLTRRTAEAGYLMLLIQPQEEPAPASILPKEVIFVVDESGSMSGEPIDQVRRAMRHALENLDPLDNFQIIRFSDSIRAFAPAPVPATPGHIMPALEYIDGLSGAGGTILIQGVKQALSYPEDAQRMRIIAFMTDGEIDNEDEILGYMQKHLGSARLFSFGVGSSPNRFLLERMATFGRGAVTYLLPSEAPGTEIKHFYDRIRSPHLTDISIDWGGLEVGDLHPSRLPDLFIGQSIALLGRYTRPGRSEVTIRARLGGRPWQRSIAVDLPERNEEGAGIDALWARARIEDLASLQPGRQSPETIEAITLIALEHRLVSPYTSFVAVEEWPTAPAGDPVPVEVPLPLPEGQMVGGNADGVVGGVIGGVVAGVTGGVTSQTQFSKEFIDSLPILGRNYQDVLLLAPGVPGELHETVRVAAQPLSVTTMSASSSATMVHGARDTDVVVVDGLGAATGPGDRTGTKDRPGLRALVTLEEVGFSRRPGEVVAVRVTITNRGNVALPLPADLSISAGTARFLIIGPDRKPLVGPAWPDFAGGDRLLAPGKSLTVEVTLNGPGGFRFAAPGDYAVVFLGGSLGLPDSNRLVLRVAP